MTPAMIPCAAFIVLYETSLSGRNIPEQPLLDPHIDHARRAISLSRAEAQFLLQDGNGRIGEAACVLAYEGIGTYRVDPDYAFSVDDIDLLGSARKKVRMSLHRACQILLADDTIQHKV